MYVFNNGVMIVRNTPERRASSLEQTHGRAGASDVTRKLPLYLYVFELFTSDTSQHALGAFSPALNLPSDWIQVHLYYVRRSAFRFVRFNVNNHLINKT